jgi:hypothetical protein
MHGEGPRGVVLEDEVDGVADGGAHQRSQHPQVLFGLRARLEGGELAVRVFAVERLDVLGPDPVGAVRGEHLGHLVEGLAGDVVEAQRGIVPFDFVRGDEVGADLRQGRGVLEGTVHRGTAERDEDGAANESGASRERAHGDPPCRPNCSTTSWRELRPGFINHH